MSNEPLLTAAVIKFTCGMSADVLQGEHLRLARRCVLDGLAVALGGSQQPGSQCLTLRKFC